MVPASGREHVGLVGSLIHAEDNDRVLGDAVQRSAMHAILQLLQDPIEGPFLGPVLMGPATHTDRVRYAAFLRSRNDPRGELLELALSLGAEPSAGVAAERRRLEELIGQVDPDWWRAVKPFVWTLGCGLAKSEPPAVRFAFECPKAWESLAPTSVAGVRHCDSCGEQVYLSRSRREAESNARQQRCIAVPASVASEVSTDVTRNVLGRPHPPSLWAAQLFSD